MDATRASCTSGTISLRTRLGFVFRLLASWVELRAGLPSSSAWPSRSIAFSALENLTSSMLVPRLFRCPVRVAPGRLPHISNSYGCTSSRGYVLFTHTDCGRPGRPGPDTDRHPERTGERHERRE